MNKFAISYKYISEIILTQQEHGLSAPEVEALVTAQKALLLIEMLGLSTREEPQKTI